MSWFKRTLNSSIMIQTRKCKSSSRQGIKHVNQENDDWPPLLPTHHFWLSEETGGAGEDLEWAAIGD